ncbi:RNA polymerase sigma factor SigF [Nocardiopsis dassonvillei]|uniref:SigB/SigF/SigG family RNA polymerase sigma factor n=1 Tax=Nocardiopsis dassonvillei TaxID=2014 RepID=UPI003F576391
MFPTAAHDASPTAAKGLIPRPRKPVEYEAFEKDSAEDLLTRLHSLEEGDPRARHLWEQIVEEFEPLVARMAGDYRGKGEPLEDVMQTAMVGLVKAVRGFDPSRGTPFMAYLRPTVTGEIKRHFRDRTWAVHVPRSHQENRIKLRRVLADFEQDHARRPTTAELARRMGLSEKEASELLQASEAYRCLSLDKPETSEDDSGEGIRLEDRLGEEETAFEQVLERETLKPALADLDERARTILHLRFFDDCTQAEIGEHVGCSQMHVSRLLREVLDRLRERVDAPSRQPSQG